jgi:hypothetical protein
VLIFRSPAARARLFDWRLEHWEMGAADLWPLLQGTHRLLRSTDTALFELTAHGAAWVSQALPVHGCTFYVSLPCCATGGDVPLPLTETHMPKVALGVPASQPRAVSRSTQSVKKSGQSVKRSGIPPLAAPRSPRHRRVEFDLRSKQAHVFAHLDTSSAPSTHLPVSSQAYTPTHQLRVQTPLPVSVHTASPEHVLLAALIAWADIYRAGSSQLGSSQPGSLQPDLIDDWLTRSVLAHSDGMVPTASQLCPRHHRRRAVPQLTPPPLPPAPALGCTSIGAAASMGDLLGGLCADPLARAGLTEAAMVPPQTAAELAPLLQLGVWCIADPAPFDHSAAALTPRSVLLRHALRIVAPAIAEASARARRSAPQRVPL